MPAAHTVICRWVLLLILVWMASCSPTRSATHREPILPPDFSITVERLVQSVSQPDSIWPETLPGVSPFAHIVKWQNETLYSIAQWYTGSGKNWKRLAEANPSIKPNQIHIGDTILIPEVLLKTRQAMPAASTKPAVARTRPSTPKPAPTPLTDEITLYGPIGNGAPAPEATKPDLPVPLETLD